MPQQQQFTDEDLRSIVADPRFQDPEQRSLVFNNLSPLDKARLTVIQGNQQPPGGLSGFARGAVGDQGELPLGRLASGVTQAPRLATSIVGGLANDPINTVKDLGAGFADIARNLFKGTVQESGEAMGDVQARFNAVAPNAGKILGAPFVGAAGIPIVGPALNRIADNLEQGQFSEAAGRGAVDAAMFLAPGVAEQKGAAPLLRKTKSQTMQPGVFQKIVEGAEAISSRTFGGATRFKNFLRGAQKDLIDNFINPLVDSLASVKTEGSLFARAERTQNLIRASFDALKDQRTAQFDSLRQKFSDFAFINISEAQRLARQQVALLEKGSKTTNRQAIRELNDFAELPTVVDFDTAIGRLTTFGELGFKGNLPLGKIGEKVAKDVRASVRDSIRSSLAEVGKTATDPGKLSPLQIFDRGMELGQTLKATFNETILKKVLDASPEAVPVILRNVSIKDILQMRKGLAPAAQQQVARLFIQDIFFGKGRSRVISGESAGEAARLADEPAIVGSAPSGRAAEAGNLSGTGLLPGGERMNKPFQNEVVGGNKLERLVEDAGVERIDAVTNRPGTGRKLLDIARDAKTVGLEDPLTWNAGIVSGLMNAVVVSGVLETFAGRFNQLFNGPRSAGMLVFGSYITAVLTTSPQGIRALRMFARRSAAPNIIGANMLRIVGRKNLEEAFRRAELANAEEGPPDLQPGIVTGLPGQPLQIPQSQLPQQ